MAVEPLARIIRVILQSVPDMANIMTLILFFMLVSAFPPPPATPPSLNGPLGQWGYRAVWRRGGVMGLNPRDSLGSSFACPVPKALG